MKRLPVALLLLMLAAVSSAQDQPVVRVDVSPSEVTVGESATLEVTVLAPTTLEADALSTGMLVLGLERGMALATEQDIAAYFIAGREGAFEPAASPAFTRRQTA